MSEWGPSGPRSCFWCYMFPYVDKPINPAENKYMRYVFRLLFNAEETCLKSKHAAVVVKGGSILGFGVNYPKNVEWEMLPDAQYNYMHGEDEPRRIESVHAEMAAIKAVRNKVRLRGATLYVGRVTRNGKSAISYPCVHCRHLIDRYKIKTVYYTVDSDTNDAQWRVMRRRRNANGPRKTFKAQRTNV